MTRLPTAARIVTGVAPFGATARPKVQIARPGLRLAAGWLALALIARTASAQGGAGKPPEAPPASAASQPAPDPLGRDTPRRTVLGFMAAARGSDDETAPLYLDTELKGAAAAALARRLYVVLDARLPARLNELSDRPEGAALNPLKPDENVVGTITTAARTFDVIVVRVTRRNAAPVWLFSRATLAHVPDAYRDVDLIAVDRYLPDFAGRPRVAGIRLFEWFVLLVVLPLVYRLLGLLNGLFRPLVRAWVRRTGTIHGRPSGHVPGVIRLVIMVIGIRWVVASLDLPLLERQFWATIVALMVIAVIGWLLLLLAASGEAYLTRVIGYNGETASLVRLARRVVEVLVVAGCLVATLRYFGFDPTAALAGLGIGGIAVALAAQKTLENVIAGLSLIFDKAVKVGDSLKFGDTIGTVDYIGLRSTRIRTLDRTILTVPNGQIASVGIETLSVRDKYWFHHVVGLQYDTSAAEMRAVVAGIEKLLVTHANVDGASVRARFLRLSQSSLDVDVSAYILASDGDRFLAVQQELLLGILESVDAAGTSIAFPSQTLRIAEGRNPLARTDRSR